MKNGSKRTMRARADPHQRRHPDARTDGRQTPRVPSRDLKTRKEPMSSIWHLPVLKPKSVIWSGLRTTSSTPNIILG
jgi:hypothetical protein